MSTATNPTVETADNGREKNGRFGKGNSFANGNPYTKRVAHFRSLIANSITDADMTGIVAKLVENAKQGDIASAKLLFSYTIGQPQAFENPDFTFPAQVTDILLNKLKNEMNSGLFDMMTVGDSLEEQVFNAGQRFSKMLTHPSV